MIRRVLQTATITALTVIGMNVAGSAQTGALFFNPDTSHVLPLDSITVNIEVNSEVQGIHCFRVWVNYDRNLVEMKSVTQGPLLPSAGQTFFFSKDTMGIYDIMSCILGPGLQANGPGVLAVMKFKAKQFGGISPLTFEYAIFQDTDLDSISDVNIRSGAIKVLGDERPSIEVLSPPSGGTYTAWPNLTIHCHDDNGIDRAYYQFDGCNGIWTELWSYNSSSGDTVINWTVPTVSDGPHNIYFKVTDDAGQTNIDTCAYYWSFTYEGACLCNVGNANGAGIINILDATYLISNLYKGGAVPAPYPKCSGDANCNCIVNILDVTYLISFLYKGGSAPCACESWVGHCGPY